jgi:hypothetical protein
MLLVFFIFHFITCNLVHCVGSEFLVVHEYKRSQNGESLVHSISSNCS